MRGSEKRTMEVAINRHVGARLKAFRLYRGWSQKELAIRLHVSYQQIQKYEIGSNRIAAGMLWRLAQALGVHVGAFYDGIEDISPSPRPSPIKGEGGAVQEIPSPSPEILRIAFALESIQSLRLKAVIAEIIELAGYATPE